jgi:hypothetical protein
MDPVTLIGLIAVAAMFCTGVGLVWIGLRRRPDRLPLGADDVLAAVAEGRLVRPAGSPAKTARRKPAAAPKAASPAPTPAAETPAPTPTPAPATSRRERRAIDLVRPPAEPPRAAQATPAVRILPKDEVPARPEREAAPAPVAEQADEPVPPAPALDDTRPISTAELNDALFAGIDDPSHDEPSADERGFFADKPQLQRF